LLSFIKFFICGIFTSLLFPPFFLIPLGFVIFPYLLYLLNSKKNVLSYKSHFFSGFFYGLGFFSIFLLWLREPFFLEESTKNYAWFSYLLILYCSIYFGFIFFIIKFFKKALLKLLMLPLLIILSEFLCANFSFGFPWFSFALINSNNLIGNTLIFYLGSLGLSLITIFIFLFPYLFLLKDQKDKKLLFLIYMLTFLLVLLLFFLNKLNHNIKESNLNMKESNLISITIAQLNYPINQYLNLDEKKIKIEEITKIIKNSKSEIIIFAENEFPYLMNNESINYFQSILNNNQKLIIGSTRKEFLKYYNSLFLITRNNYQKFDKEILVPFGEFIPFRHLFNFMEFIAGEQDFTKGSDLRHIKIQKNFSIMPVICYEIIYFFRLMDHNDTNMIVNLTNDAWFGSLLGPYQHFYFTKLRAAEFNKPIVRVSKNGISAILGSDGNITDFIKLNQSDIKTITVLKENINKNYLEFHKIFFITLMILLFSGFYFNIRK
jgi:apolipoprotein N-acyltransferase